jgi:hypothetical protein
MSAQFLTHDRLASIAHTHSKRSAPDSERVVPGDEHLDHDDYRTFIVERRTPVTQNNERILANWLLQRKRKSVSA